MRLVSPVPAHLAASLLFLIDEVIFLRQGTYPFKHIVADQEVKVGHTMMCSIALTAHSLCAAAARCPLCKTGNKLISSKVQT